MKVIRAVLFAIFLLAFGNLAIMLMITGIYRLLYYVLKLFT